MTCCRSRRDYLAPSNYILLIILYFVLPFSLWVDGSALEIWFLCILLRIVCGFEISCLKVGLFKVFNFCRLLIAFILLGTITTRLCLLNWFEILLSHIAYSGLHVISETFFPAYGNSFALATSGIVNDMSNKAFSAMEIYYRFLFGFVLGVGLRFLDFFVKYILVVQMSEISLLVCFWFRTFT